MHDAARCAIADIVKSDIRLTKYGFAVNCVLRCTFSEGSEIGYQVCLDSVVREDGDIAHGVAKMIADHLEGFGYDRDSFLVVFNIEAV
jgi:hypothetical protein